MLQTEAGVWLSQAVRYPMLRSCPQKQQTQHSHRIYAKTINPHFFYTHTRTHTLSLSLSIVFVLVFLCISSNMSSAVVAAGASSSCSAAFTRNHSIKTIPTPHSQRTSFQGLSIQDVKKGLFNSFIANKSKSSFNITRRGLEITARTARAPKNIEVEVDKPLGLTLGQKPGGGVTITAVEGGGNAAKAGLKAGDQVLYTSSFFGDELWPADKLGFTKTAIQAKPDSVYFVVSRGADVDVKRLPKRPAPPRFGRKLTESQKERLSVAS
ncbi:hypothetical protein ACSBR1_008804 [Camellia fascicularis]